MAKLNSKHKQMIVVKLAQFHTPTEVQNELKELYGLDVPLNQIMYYNPESAGGTQSKALVRLFRSAREETYEECVKVPAYNKGYRLQMLQKMIEKQYSRGNHVLVASLLEQAAKEAGGAYEGKAQEPNRDRGGVTNYNFIQQINQKIDNSGILD